MAVTKYVDICPVGRIRIGEDAMEKSESRPNDISLPNWYIGAIIVAVTAILLVGAGHTFGGELGMWLYLVGFGLMSIVGLIGLAVTVTGIAVNIASRREPNRR